MNYYDRLGIAKSASSSQIKKAYHRAALKHHPDKGGDEDTFKEISKAYEILSDTDKRKLYDQYGEAAFANNGSGDPSTGTTFSHPFFSSSSSSSSSFSASSPFDFFQSFGNSNNINPGGGSSSTFFHSFGADSNGSTFGDLGGDPFQHLFQEMMMNGSGGRTGQSRRAGGGGGVGGHAFRSFPSSPSSASSTANRQQDHTTTTTPLAQYERPLLCTLEDLYHGTTKKLKVTIQGQSKIYEIMIQPGWKTGTKIKFQSTSASFPYAMTFILQEQKHSLFSRHPTDHADLIYRYRIPSLRYDATNDDDHRQRNPVLIEIPLLDGTTWSRYVHPRHMRPGKTIIVPHHGMPIRRNTNNNKDNNENKKVYTAAEDILRTKQQYGNLIIEFYSSDDADQQSD
jgi:DnaJ homolog subfamily B member 4